MSEKVNVNGALFDASEAVIPVLDHGFLFGDSIYETVRAYGGQFFRLRKHFERLQGSAGSLAIKLPVGEEELIQRARATMEAAEVSDAAVRMVVTRGVGPLDIDPSGCGTPNVLVFARPRPRYPEGAYAGSLALSIVSRPRNGRRSLDPNVKSGNYLNNVLALVEARDEGAFEGVMLNARGEVAECTTSNVFMVRDGAVVTPPLSAGLLGGITRATVLSLCVTEGVPCSEESFGADDLRGADEVFITSAMKQVMPMGRIDGKTVGKGGAGPVSLRLLRAYRAAVMAETGVAPDEDS